MIITLDYIIKYRHMCAGVSDNRLQNVVITLDKVKLCLERPGQLSALTTSSLPADAFRNMQSSLHTAYDSILDTTGLLVKHTCSVTTAA
jgi:hypothetical protein